MSGILYGLMSIIYIAGCVALVTVILLQKKRSGGIGSIAGMGNAQTYWDKNKGRSVEGKLENYTKILGVTLGILTVVMCLF